MNDVINLPIKRVPPQISASSVATVKENELKRKWLTMPRRGPGEVATCARVISGESCQRLG